jgi:hypothetical protein
MDNRRLAATADKRPALKPPEERDRSEWAERIKTALKARETAKELRGDKPAGFPERRLGA